jgi:hypothetical protein
VADDVEKATNIAKSMDFVENAEPGVDSILLTIRNPIENNSVLMQSLLSQGVKIVEFAEEEASLEDLYLEVLKGGDN